MQTINLDNNATTPVLPEIWEAMRPYFLEESGNPASSHRAGQAARKALEDAREKIAQFLGAFPDEVIFTSGATEANNLALFGLAGQPPGVVAASSIEHPCVLEPVRQLEGQGFSISFLKPDTRGLVEIKDNAFPPETRLVSIMLANHETGAVQPIKTWRSLFGEETCFHCDAAAAAGKIPISFHELGVTALTVSAHKFHGPKGIGALLLRRHTKLRPMLWGGHQQQGRRPGTEPVALAVGMARALDLARIHLSSHQEKLAHLRRTFLNALKKTASPFVLNGPEEGGLLHTLNLSFPGCKADVLLMNLDLEGVACSTGSACSSGSLLPSPVLQAMGLSGEILNSAMRFSMNPYQKEAEIVEAAQRISLAVNRLRQKKLN